MRVLPNKTKSNRPSERVRKGPHARTYLLWQVLFASLIFDPLYPLLATPLIPVDLAVFIATLCAMAILPFLAQAAVHKMLSKLRRLHSKSLEVGSKTAPLLLVFSAGIVILFKMFMFMHLPPALLVALLLIIAWGSRKYIAQTNKQSQEDKALFDSNPWAKVQRWEHQVIVFATLPLLLARAIGLCGALAFVPSGDESTRLLLIGMSALFLGMLRPDRTFFMGICKGCKRPVPIVFQDIGSCLNCNVNLRIAYHAWANRLSLIPSPQGPHNNQPPSEQSAQNTPSRATKKG